MRPFHAIRSRAPISLVRTLAAGVGLLLTTVTPALAAPIEVVLINAPGCGPATTRLFNPGEVISVNVSPCTAAVRVRALDGVSDIGRLTISGTIDPKNTLFVSVANGAFPSSDLPVPAAGGSFGGLAISDSTTRARTVFSAGFAGNLTGSIDTGELRRLDAGGAITAFVTTDRGGPDTVISASAVTASGHIEIRTGDLRMLSVAGDVRSQIRVDDGMILDGVTIGGSQLDGWIIADAILGPIRVGGTLRRVQATAQGALIAGDITAGQLGAPFSGIPPVNTFQFVGSIATTGDLSEPLAIGAGGWTPGNLISIGGSLQPRSPGLGRAAQGNRMLFLVDPDREDGVLSSPMAGQIIINAMNRGAPAADANGDGSFDERDLWLGDISIDYPTNADIALNVFSPAKDEVLIGPNRPQPFRAPYYHALPEQLGGGSIALAPFEVHPMESSPSRGERLRGVVRSATVAYYGPVIDADNDPATPPIRVERAPDPLPALGFDGPGSEVPGAIWTDVTDRFTVTMTPDGQTRHVRIEGTFGPGYYRFVAANGEDHLRCDLVRNLPPVRAHDDDPTMRPWEQGHHWFRVVLAIGGFDRDGDGDVDRDDIIRWFMNPGDANRDGFVDAADLLDLVDAVFDL